MIVPFPRKVGAPFEVEIVRGYYDTGDGIFLVFEHIREVLQRKDGIR